MGYFDIIKLSLP